MMMIWIILYFQRKSGFISNSIGRHMVDVVVFFWVHDHRLHWLLLCHRHHLRLRQRRFRDLFTFFKWEILINLGIINWLSQSGSSWLLLFVGWKSIMRRWSIIFLNLLDFSHPWKISFMKDHNHLSWYINVEYFLRGIHFKYDILLGVAFLV